MLSLPMACVVFMRDEPAEIYLVKHTYELNSDATNAMQQHVTKWLLTATGRHFIREHENSQHEPLWAALFEQHSEMLAKTPGILAIDLLPCHVTAVWEEDDTTSPWNHDYVYEENSPFPQPFRAIWKLDKVKIRQLLDHQPSPSKPPTARTTTAMTEEKDKKPNPAVTDNGDGTKTLEYRETEDQRRIRETAAQTATPAKPGAKPA